jgi:8-oxo-dGTP pyrophosphatase MutT (NUDIX family)
MGIVRDAARVLLLDAHGRVLLLRFRDPVSGRRLWMTPGGALEAGETHEQAALRELTEETGLRGITLAASAGEREHHFTWNGQDYHQRERFFVAEVVDSPAIHAPGLEAGEIVDAVGWHAAADLSGLGDPFTPPDLAERLAALRP